MNTILKNHAKLHFVVLLYGFTAILGKLISLPSAQLVWYRTLIAATILALFMRYKKISFSIGWKPALQIMGVGLIVALHWIAFFGAVKISNISVTLGCMASTTLFASFLEPLLFRRAVKWIEVVIGLLIISGLYMIFQFELDRLDGILIALASALLAGLFTVLNKLFINKYHPVTISFYEMGSGFAGITIYLWLGGQLNTNLALSGTSDLVFLLLLGVVCTAYAFVASVDVMKVLSAYTVILAINMEPIYGIVLAYSIFGQSEYMSSGFYLGTAIILLAVFIHPYLNHKLARTDKVSSDR